MTGVRRTDGYLDEPQQNTGDSDADGTNAEGGWPGSGEKEGDLRRRSAQAWALLLQRTMEWWGVGEAHTRDCVSD